MKRGVAPLGACLILTGCLLGPDFQPPPPPPGSGFTHTAKGTTTQSDPEPDWWKGFNDPVLEQVMRIAIAGSPNLQQSLLRVQEAHQQTAIQAAQGLPSLSAAGEFTREDEGLKGLAQSAGAFRRLNTLAPDVNRIAPGAGGALDSTLNGAVDQISQPVNFWQYELSSSWELDLFGRVRRSVEAARANQAEAEDAARDALVMLESQIAQAYFQLRAAQASLLQQQQIVQAASTSLDLTTSQANHGLAPYSDEDQARTELLSAQGQLPTYEKDVAQSMDQIDILAGRPPGGLDWMLSRISALPAPPPVIGAGVPASLARRRPDIREAEDSLHAATAQIGVAVASFYPDVSLTGSVGYHAFDASYLTNWANLFYSFGPSVSLPVFQGGRLIANLRLARLQQAGAALQYRATVLNALAEVENALVAYHADQQTNLDAQATVQSAQDSFNLAQTRYANGLDSFLPALVAEQTLFSDQQRAIQAQAQLDEDVTSLYTALGGGWQETEQMPPVPEINGAPPPSPAAMDALPEAIAPSAQPRSRG
jgi:NodT family efflux transporter outer membrane factor (OMF) lipoprotein